MASVAVDNEEHHIVMGLPDEYRTSVDDSEALPPAPNYVITWALALFLGWCGADRFYLKRHVSGVFKLLTLGGLGVWYLIDFMGVLGERRWHKNGRRVEGHRYLVGTMWLLSAPAIILGLWVYDLLASAIYPPLSFSANHIDG